MRIAIILITMLACPAIAAEETITSVRDICVRLDSDIPESSVGTEDIINEFRAQPDLPLQTQEFMLRAMSNTLEKNIELWKNLGCATIFSFF